VVRSIYSGSDIHNNTAQHHCVFASYQQQPCPTSPGSIAQGCWTLASSASAAHDAVTSQSWWHSSETGCRWMSRQSRLLDDSRLADDNDRLTAACCSCTD